MIVMYDVLLIVCGILQLGKIHVSAKKVLIPKIKSLVNEGDCYEIENVLVTHSEAKFRFTAHRYRLNLMDSTRFTKIDSSTIPTHHFDFVSFKEIIESPREDRHVGKLRIVYIASSGLRNCC